MNHNHWPPNHFSPISSWSVCWSSNHWSPNMLVQLSNKLRKRNGLTLWWPKNGLNMNKQPSQWFKSGKSEDLNVCIYVDTIYINTNYIYLYIILFAYRHTIFQTYRQKIHAKIKQLLLFRTQLQPDSCPQNCSPGTSSTSMLHQQIDSQKANENELVVWNILAKLEHFPKKRGWKFRKNVWVAAT